MIFGTKTTVTIKRRIEGDRNAAGEPDEDWANVAGSVNIKVNIQPIDIQRRAKIEDAGLIQGQIVRIYLEPNTAIKEDDRIYDSKNYYVVHSLEPWPTHIEATCSVTARQ